MIAENLRMKSMIKHKEGFTLFELLIALSIGTILIMSGAYAIRTGLFSMEREETWFNDSTKEKAAFDFFWQQVSSLRVQKIPRKDTLLTEENKTTKKKKTKYFSGEKDFLSFVSPLSFKKHYGQGLVIANYKVKLNDDGILWDLIYMETRVTPAILIKLAEESESTLNTDKDYTIFLKDFDMISFAYLDTVEEETDDEGEVQVATLDADVIEGTDLKWKEKITERIPQAIKLSVTKNGKAQELISPIMATYSFLASGQ